MGRSFVYGPRVLPDVTTVERQWTTMISFVTDRDSVAWMLPKHFAPTDRPVVSFMHQQLHHVDYMRGRGYNLLNVMVSARFEGSDGTIEAPFPLVIWENNTMPIIAGRELHGNPKIFGEVSDLETSDDARSFEVAEYGTTLVRGQVEGLQEADQDRVARTNAGSAESLIFGWKLIPSADGGVDVDYPTLIHGSSTFERVWRGESELTIFQPDADAAPYSSVVVEALAELPRVETRPAFHGVGTAKLFRNRTVRLSA
jgi:acetoacetate decarboxylase